MTNTQKLRHDTYILELWNRSLNQIRFFRFSDFIRFFIWFCLIFRLFPTFRLADSTALILKPKCPDQRDSNTKRPIGLKPFSTAYTRSCLKAYHTDHFISWTYLGQFGLVVSLNACILLLCQISDVEGCGIGPFDRSGLYKLSQISSSGDFESRAIASYVMPFP